MPKNQHKRSLSELLMTQVLLTNPLTSLWGSLVNHLTHQFDLREQVEHLENCLILAEAQTETISSDDQWNFLAHLTGGLLLYSEPTVWQGTDNHGEQHWYVYDPKTGKVTAWETEEEVRTWLGSIYHC
jgi:hypothetical protein